MGNLTRTFLDKFRRWDRASQTGFTLAILLLIPALVTAAAGPEDLRGIATGSVIGLVISAQVIFMWANRGMVSDYTRAQRAFLNGDFAAARELLEGIVATDKAGAQEWTLLGNVHRQLGDLDASESALNQALAKQSDHPFPLYGLGKTQLVGGRYGEAAKTINRALERGAPVVVLVDLLEARFRDGDHDLARDVLDDAEAAAMLDEAHRRLIVAWLRYQLGEGDIPEADLIETGLPYWEAEAGRYAHTPYGAAVAADVESLRGLQH